MVPPGNNCGPLAFAGGTARPEESDQLQEQGGAAVLRTATDPPMARRPAERGFTIVEMMIAVVVIGVLAAIAIPSFRNVQLNNAGSAAVNDLVASMTYARGEANKQRRDVVVCPLADGESGTCEPSTSGWNNGWLVFVDRVPVETPPALGDEDTILREFPREPATVNVTADQVAFAFRTYGGTSTSGSITFCDDRGADHARGVIVTASGKVRPSSTTLDGEDLAC